MWNFAILIAPSLSVKSEVDSQGDKRPSSSKNFLVHTNSALA
jgi:hypothetical protein